MSDTVLNASLVPGSDNEQPSAGEWIGAIDVDSGQLGTPHIRLRDRVAASLGYLGLFPPLVYLSSPDVLFVRRHNHIAFALFALRLVVLGGILALWWGYAANGAPGERVAHFSFDFLFTIAVGVPLGNAWREGALPLLAAPVGIASLATLAASAIALTGRTLDWRGLTTADWTDSIRNRSYLGISPEDERTLARRARARQIERLQKSSRMLQVEHRRRTNISDVELQLERVGLQREYHDQLLALGEISQRRYDQVNTELDDQVAELRMILSNLETRIDHQGRRSAQGDFSRLRRPAETLMESLVFVTPDGVPIFTYGQFQHDDAIVAGMLSAFDSLSQEVFGSRVTKTALTEGQVLYFSHGDYVVAMASFVDEPSPRQVEDLRTMIRQFEAANSGPISRNQYDPQYLHQVPVPFRFTERMPRAPEPTPETD